MTQHWLRFCLPLFLAAILLSACASSKGRLFAMVDMAVEGAKEPARFGRGAAPRQTEVLWVDAQHYVLKASHTANAKTRARYIESARKCVNMLRWEHPDSKSVRRLDAQIAALETQDLLQSEARPNLPKIR